MRLTIQAGTVTEYKNGSEVTENIYYQNVDELMEEFEKQKSEFKNPKVTEDEIMKFAEKSQDSKRIQKLGQYEDIDENPKHLADLKKALEIIKVLFQGRAMLYERNDGIEQTIDENGNYHKTNCVIYILDFHVGRVHYEFHLHKDEYDLLKEVLL